MALFKKEHEIILKHLQEYGSITSYEARDKYGIIRLPKYISELRLLDDIHISEDWILREDELGNTHSCKVYLIR